MIRLHTRPSATQTQINQRAKTKLAHDMVAGWLAVGQLEEGRLPLFGNTALSSNATFGSGSGGRPIVVSRLIFNSRDMRRRSLALLFTLLLAPRPWSARAFAEWTQCWTELGEGEIVMNQEVRRQDAAVVRLIAMDTNGRPVQPTRMRKEDAPAQDDSQNDNKGPDDRVDEANRLDGVEVVIPFTPGQTFHLKLEYASPPNDDACTSSINSNDIAPALPANTQYLAQTTAGARFLGRAAMCEGMRAVGRNRDDIIRIQLTAGDSNDDNEETDAVVRVWAGYASEKAAVLLTPELVFRRYDTRSSSTDLDGASDRIRVSSSPNPSPHPSPAPAPAPSISKPAKPAVPVHLPTPDL